MPSIESSEILLGTELLQSLGSNKGSNLLVLSGKRKDKRNSKQKIPKDENVPLLSKSKQKKLKKLEEDKKKKNVEAKCLDLLEQYKIREDAFDLLRPSGKVGQVETMKEKRIRDVHFAKAGFQKIDVGGPAKCSKARFKDTGFERETKRLKLELEDTPCSEVGLEETSEGATQCGEEIFKEDLGRKILDDAGLCGSSQLAGGSDSNTMMGSEVLSLIKDCDIQDKSEKALNLHSQTKEAFVKLFMEPPVVVHVTRPTEILEKRKDLPIVMMEQEIMESINENLVVILCGETGCGKTTQVPQFLYEAGFGSSSRLDRKGRIGITQPRRVAVLSTAKRVSFELGLELGREVGFQVRHDKMIGSNCSIKFMTDGILLREVQSDFLLKQYSVILLDEAHERSLNTDILIGMLSRVIKVRQTLYAEQQEKLRLGVEISPENMISQLRLVLMSATLRVEDFISNNKLFDPVPPVLEVPVRQFPVSLHFSKRTHEDYLGQAYRKVLSIHRRLPPGGILVFVTGQREVEYLCKKFRSISRKFVKDKVTKEVGEHTPSSTVDMKAISEACDVEEGSTEQLDFGEEEETYKSINMDSDSSDIEENDEMDSDSAEEDPVSSEFPEETGKVLNFLGDIEKLALLKASFDSLSRGSGEVSCPEKPIPATPHSERPQNCTNFAPGGLHVLPLYAMLPASAQLRVFQDVPEDQRLVIVATNVAETSLTIPGIKYVVDTGKEKVKNYNYKTGMAAYEVQWISKASASQRAGRAGRTGPGQCYRLYSSAAFGKDDLFPEFSYPEISKIPVDGVVLLMKSMGIDKVPNFPFPTPPKKEAIVEAEHCLKALEALDGQGKLTALGKAMAYYPMSPRHSRMLLTVIQIARSLQGYGRMNLLLSYSVAAASALSFPSPFLKEVGDKKEDDGEVCQKEKVKDSLEKKTKKKLKALAREARAKFSNPTSDALTVAFALQLFELSESPTEFCTCNLLHLKTMEEMSKLRKQLLQLIFYQSKFCEDFAWNHGNMEDVENAWRINSDKNPLRINEEEFIGQAICAGWADRVAKRVRPVSYSKESDQKVNATCYQSSTLKDIIYLHRSSSVSRMAPEFLVYTELLNIRRPYMHGVTSVKSDWLLRYASSLCTFSAPLTDPKPFYDPEEDQVFCWVSPTFGQHNWQLPLHRIVISKSDVRTSVFACALLEGDVLPCLKPVQKFLAMPSSFILKTESLGQRRVGDLLNRMKIGRLKIDTRAKLREVWSRDQQFLYTEIQSWFQEPFHSEFPALWKKMHQEAHLVVHELFPKKTKKVKSF